MNGNQKILEKIRKENEKWKVERDSVKELLKANDVVWAYFEQKNSEYQLPTAVLNEYLVIHGLIKRTVEDFTKRTDRSCKDHARVLEVLQPRVEREPERVTA